MGFVERVITGSLFERNMEERTCVNCGNKFEMPSHIDYWVCGLCNEENDEEEKEAEKKIKEEKERPLGHFISKNGYRYDEIHLENLPQWVWGKWSNIRDEYTHFEEKLEGKKYYFKGKTFRYAICVGLVEFNQNCRAEMNLSAYKRRRGIKKFEE